MSLITLFLFHLNLTFQLVNMEFTKPVLFFFAQDDLENFGDVGSLEDNVESFLSHDGGGDGNIYGSLKQSLSEHKTETSKGGI